MKLSFSTAACSLLMLAVLCSCASCVRRPTSTEIPGRAQPAYVQWLEEQACLRRSSELTAIVSGSFLPWKYGSGDIRFPESSRIWFRVSPALTAWNGSRSFLKAFGQGPVIRHLADIGVQGIFFSGMGDTGDEWAGRSPARSLGEDCVSLSFGRMAGTEEEYAHVAAGLSERGLSAGGSLMPSATGMGPDFFLAARAVRDYPGLYAMMETDTTLWPLFPSLKKDETALLPDRAKNMLTQQGHLPDHLVQDEPDFSSVPCGWAVTGPVDGVDGVKRRWVYRWYLHPDRPVLYWDDPSGAARKILEASLIQHIGLRHQALVGATIGAWAGLDTSPTDQTSAAWNPEPGYSALRDLVRNTHRYGAALLVLDDLPMERLPVLMRTGADFLFDSVLSPALERSLLEGNALAVQIALKRALALGIDQTRLWRGTADGLFRPSLTSVLPLLPEDWQACLVPEYRSGKELRINAATLSAAACGLAPGTRPDAEKRKLIRDGHLLQLAVRAFLPGMLMLSGQDLDGALPEGADWPATPPLWQMETRTSSPQGLPSGFSVYRNDPEADILPLLKRLLAARTSIDMANGRLEEVPDCENAVLFTLCSLPDGGHLAFFGNFSQKEVQVHPEHALWSQAASRLDAVSGQAVSSRTLTLPPWGWKAVLLR